MGCGSTSAHITKTDLLGVFVGDSIEHASFNCGAVYSVFFCLGGYLTPPLGVSNHTSMWTRMQQLLLLRIPEVVVCVQPPVLQPATSTASLVDTHRELPTASAAAAADKSALDAAITSTVQACTDKLRNLDVSQVAFLCVSPASDVHRIGFRWSDVRGRELVREEGEKTTEKESENGKAPLEGGCGTVVVAGPGYARVPMLSFIEPPTACMLETDTLPTVQRYVPSYAHQLHTFVVQVRHMTRPTPSPDLVAFFSCCYVVLTPIHLGVGV